MNGQRPTRWLSRRRAILLAALALLVGGVVVVKAASSLEVTHEGRKASPTTAPAASQPATSVGGVVIDSSKTEIEIGLSYGGERLECFGTLGEKGADAVIVKLTSPAQKVKLNQKGRIGPFWMTVKQHEVDNVPFMYQISASDRIDAILSEQQRKTLGIGFGALRRGMVIETVKGDSDPADANTVFDGLIQMKTEQGLYEIVDDATITIKQGRLFKHAVHFPPAAKEGLYQLETYAFRQGRLVGQAADVIRVRKVGLEAKIVRWASEYPKTYGVCAVIMALAAGLLVGFLFKKGGQH